MNVGNPCGRSVGLPGSGRDRPILWEFPINSTGKGRSVPNHPASRCDRLGGLVQFGCSPQFRGKKLGFYLSFGYAIKATLRNPVSP
ncbi:MAG: hypothetical protein ACP5D7_24900, partial [Limnospira sp.]